MKSVVARVANKFSVCAAEVDDMDVWQIATIGITTVSNDSRHNNEVLSKAVDFIIACTSDAEVLDYEIELLCVL